jgi:putative cell wall-binding protein
MPVQRIYGQDAIGTSIAVSQAEYPNSGSAQAVVLARSDYFSDALAGGPLAIAVGGPLLITPGASISSTLDSAVQSEVQRVLPSGGTVYVLGGALALSPNIDTTLEGLGYEVKRVAGSDAYATAVAIAEQLGNPSTLLEATGTNFADALSAVPAAIQAHGAILLTEGSTQAPETATYLAAHPADTRYAIGGPLAAAGADPSATPVWGEDLYATSAAVASKFFPTATSFGAATGVNFPDALSGGVFMGMTGHVGPVLLVEPSLPLPSSISDYLGEDSSMSDGYLFGGPLAVGDDVLAAL